jgi:hypothetical protein
VWGGGGVLEMHNHLREGVGGFLIFKFAEGLYIMLHMMYTLASATTGKQNYSPLCSALFSVFFTMSENFA